MGGRRHWLLPPALALTPLFGNGPLTDWVFSLNARRRLQHLPKIMSWLKKNHLDLSETHTFWRQTRLRPRLVLDVSPVSSSGLAQCRKCSVDMCSMHE